MATKMRQYLPLVVVLAAKILFFLWHDLPQALRTIAEGCV